MVRRSETSLTHTGRYVALVAILGAAWSTDAHGQQRGVVIRNGLRADLVGCYALYSGRDRVATSLWNASPSVRLDSLAIDTSSAATRSGVARAMYTLDLYNDPMPPVPSRPHDGRRSWAADSLTDSIRLSFVDGFSGAQFVLSARGSRPDTLTGRLFVSWDMGPTETNHGPARAIRQSCARVP